MSGKTKRPDPMTLDEAMRACTTDRERELFSTCCLALGALRMAGHAGLPGARQVARMVGQGMNIIDPWSDVEQTKRSAS